MVDWGDVPTWCLVVLGGIGGAAALRQLRLQRIQLGDQQKVIERQTAIQERQQANMVDVAGVGTGVSDPSLFPGFKATYVDLLTVANSSDRPIRNVTARMSVDTYIKGRGRAVLDPFPASAYGEMKTFVNGKGQPVPPGSTPDVNKFVWGGFAWDDEDGDSPIVLRAGHTVGFVWEPQPGAGIDGQRWWVRFTDDAGLHWQIDPDLHLAKLDTRDW